MTAPRRRLVASELPALLRSVLAALAVSREEIDSLNVFPVPDGDTGTNLHTTVQSAVDALEASDWTHADDADLALAATRGALRGAAGNSGVIFSQFVRALAEHLGEGPLELDGLADVFDRARSLGYEAVAEPVPGTILTAMDAAAGAAGDLGPCDHLGQAMAAVLEAVGAAVAASRDVLDANRRAGVVDAGARGFEVAVDGLVAFLEGRQYEAVPPPPVRRTVGDVVTRESGSVVHGYEVQYLLEAPDDTAGHLRTALEALGDSVVVVACGGLLNVHVHTDDVDGAIAAGATHGEPARVQVTAFADQIAAVDARAGTDEVGPSPCGPTAVGYVAVVPGSGLAELVRKAAAVPVDGAAGALPTVATVLNAIGTVEADEVVLLPGHPNVVPTMHQASAVSVAEGGRALHVVDEAASVPAVLAVLAVGAVDALELDRLAAVATHCTAGEVVAAVRDADTPLGRVRTGQWLGVVDGTVATVTDDVDQALLTVVAGVVTPDCEIVTLIAGAEVDDDERDRLLGRVQAAHPSVDVEVVDGRQRPARWIVGAE